MLELQPRSQGSSKLRAGRIKGRKNKAPKTHMKMITQ